MKAHFRKTGWIFVPVSLAGWIVTLLYAAVSIFTLVMIDCTYNNLKNSLIRFFPYFISLSVLFFWIASNSTGEKHD
jgi:succinate-acetate transporter protein